MLKSGIQGTSGPSGPWNFHHLKFALHAQHFSSNCSNFAACVESEHSPPAPPPPTPEPRDTPIYVWSQATLSICPLFPLLTSTKVPIVPVMIGAHRMCAWRQRLSKDASVQRRTFVASRHWRHVATSRCDVAGSRVLRSDKTCGEF